MFNRGKTNQEKSKEIDQNGNTGCFRDPVGNGFHVCVGKTQEREREWKIGTKPPPNYSLHRISAERHPRSLF